MSISIHAPQWGATSGYDAQVSGSVISIHAPQWGATGDRPEPMSVEVFQSTHPSGVRHAARDLDDFLGYHFNPRTPVGCDPAADSAMSPAPRFQSTHPSGVRLLAWFGGDEHCLFQSTHPSGVRLGVQIPLPCVATISIHAPQWGATQPSCPWTSWKNYFNPRTPVGCDSFNLRRNHHSQISIHAPQWGATYYSAYLR